jgi:hypothetical protein
MTKSLTSLISDVQAALIDDGTRFNTATCTAAVREALKIFNLFAPVITKSLVTPVANQREYELTATAPTALSIVGIWLYDDTGKSHHIPLTYDQFTQDEKLYFCLLAPQSADEQLLVRYTVPQTINGLDSATTGTLSTLYDQILIGGAKAEAMQIRADSRLETINLQQAVSDNYREQITAIRARFYMELQQVANNRYPAVGTPAEAAWNDNYHGWDQ